jgi:putative ABC transport system permease protein
MRVKMDGFNETITNVASVWNEFDANFDFEYDFLDQMLGQQYIKEQKMGVVFGSFAVLAIIIACLGLAAIAAIDFSTRKKEIGIRKVLGAPYKDLAISLLKEYTFVVLIALLVASPLWWIAMSNWLNNFNFRISLNPLFFVVSGILLVFISWMTLGYLTYSTVSANPVEALQED